MTIKKYISKYGWHFDKVDSLSKYRSMTVDISFINDKGDEDETEFDINAFNVNELAALYNDFCKENGFKNNTVINVIVVAVYEEKVGDR